MSMMPIATTVATHMGQEENFPLRARCRIPKLRDIDTSALTANEGLRGWFLRRGTSVWIGFQALAQAIGVDRMGQKNADAQQSQKYRGGLDHGTHPYTLTSPALLRLVRPIGFRGTSSFSKTVSSHRKMASSEVSTIFLLNHNRRHLLVL
jgi:hypothetical protein